MALITLVAIAAVGYMRFTVAPFDNETVSARILPPLAGYLSMLSSACPKVCVCLSWLFTIVAGMYIGQMGSRFRLYPTLSFISMPMFGFMACGIFISCDVLSSAFASLMATLALRFICRGYLRERDLSSMLYAGICTGLLLLVSTYGAVYLFAALSALFILSFSAREILVLLIAITLPPLLFCYTEWAFGGDFLSPLTQIESALLTDSGIDSFGNDAVCALLLCGLLGFVFVCSAVHFLMNRFMISLKSRGILIYNIVLSMLSIAMFALPCSTPADFAVAAVPLSTVMPVLFIREGERLSAVLYLSLWVVFILHLFYY